MRLIDADALKEEFRFVHEAEIQIYGNASYGFVEECANIVNDAPTIEAEPVRHGHWIEYPRCLAYDGAFSDDHIVCSVCESVWSVLDNCTERFDCCPHCGAKMDEVTP